MLSPLFALAQAASSAQPAAGAGELDRNTDIVRLVADATVIGKIVLLILLIFSAISWAVIFYKIWAFRRSEQQSATFLGVFIIPGNFAFVERLGRSRTPRPAPASSLPPAAPAPISGGDH